MAWLGFAVGTVVILLAMVYCALAYYIVTTKRNRMRNAWAQLDLQLKHRHDVIKDIVNGIRVSLAQENLPLDSVWLARLDAMEAGSDPSRRVPAENHLTETIGPLLEFIDANALKLQEGMPIDNLRADLTSTEASLPRLRDDYNRAAHVYMGGLHTYAGRTMSRWVELTPAEPISLDAPDRSMSPISR